MHTTIVRQSCVLTVALALLAVPTVAQARPGPGPQPPVPYILHRPLERVGTQFVRGDDLTGNGVEAPLWIAER